MLNCFDPIFTSSSKRMKTPYSWKRTSSTSDPQNITSSSNSESSLTHSSTPFKSQALTRNTPISHNLWQDSYKNINSTPALTCQNTEKSQSKPKKKLPSSSICSTKISATPGNAISSKASSSKSTLWIKSISTQTVDMSSTEASPPHTYQEQPTPQPTSNSVKLSRWLQKNCSPIKITSWKESRTFSRVRKISNMARLLSTKILFLRSCWKYTLCKNLKAKESSKAASNPK